MIIRVPWLLFAGIFGAIVVLTTMALYALRKVIVVALCVYLALKGLRAIWPKSQPATSSGPKASTDSTGRTVIDITPE